MRARGATLCSSVLHAGVGRISSRDIKVEGRVTETGKEETRGREEGESEGKGTRTFLSEVGKLADGLNPLLALRRLEEYDLPLELLLLFNCETRAVWDAVVILHVVLSGP